MISNIATRRTAGAITAALVLGTAGPAVARPVDSRGPVPVAPPAQVHQRPHHGTANPLPPAASAPAERARPKVSHSASGSSLVYVLLGGVVVAIGGLGGTLVASNRRRTATPRPRIAA